MSRRLVPVRVLCLSFFGSEESGLFLAIVLHPCVRFGSGISFVAMSFDRPGILLFDMGGVLVRWDGIDAIRGLMKEPVERDVDRSELLAAEEAFFCGTAWEVTPILSIDRVDVGPGRIGPKTKLLQEAFFGFANIIFESFEDFLDLPDFSNRRTGGKSDKISSITANTIRSFAFRPL